MNNEIKRKITSLTLMTIMLAGGMVIAAPGMDPAHAANANLNVSANTFGGPMVVEIMVNDPNLKDDTDESMPNVTIDGKDLAMAQGTDGNWYAYVADKNMAAIANNNLGLDFGVLIADPNTNLITALGSNVFDSDVVAYSVGQSTGNLENLVVKSARSLDSAGNGNGQIHLIADAWPIIQTFVFTDDSNIRVIYETTPSQTEVIIYDEDMDDFALYDTDRTSYPHNADIHLVLDDMQLNIDPTDEDVWTFNVNNGTSYYGIQGTNSITPADQDSLFYGDNGFLAIDAKQVIKFRDNNDSNLVVSGNTVTVEETLPNSGIFENTDAANAANLYTTTGLIRDDSGIIDYNDVKSSILVSYFGGSILMDKASIDGDWKSGEKLTVTVTDEDENKNTKKQDIFSVSNPNVKAIPALTIGTPITLDDKTVVNSPTGTTLVQLGLNNVILQDEVDLATQNRTSFTAWLGLNQTSTAVQQDVVDAIQIALLNEITNSGPNVVALTSQLQGANVELSANQTATNTSQSGVDQLSNLITSNTLLINTNNIAIERGFDGTILTNFFIDTFSKRLIVTATALTTSTLQINYDNTILDLQNFMGGNNTNTFLNYDLSGFGINVNAVSVTDGVDTVEISSSDTGYAKLTPAMKTSIDLLLPEATLTVLVEFASTTLEGDYPLVMDFVRYGGDNGRINDAIYRYEAEESTDASGIFTGTVEYIMLNQINLFNAATFDNLETIGDQLTIIVHEDLTEEDALELIYFDVDKQGQRTQVSDQMDAPTTSARITFDSSNYKVADTVTVTIEDSDLNTDSDIIDIYTVISTNTISHPNFAGLTPATDPSRLFDVTFNDVLWANTGCGEKGLFDSMNSIIETSKGSGIFTGTFQIPSNYCNANDTVESVTGLDIKINYVDFRDASGETIEVGDSAGIRAHTGSVSLDRTVYPVPWGVGLYSNFPLHATAAGNENLPQGDLTIHVRVNDPDFDISASGEDKIQDGTVGPVTIKVSRGGSDLVLATAGANTTATIGGIVELGPITEIAPDAGIFELDMIIKYDDGPYTNACPDPNTSIGCILQGDILQVQYNDPTDASGSANTVTDSATFDLRNGVLQSDKSVYVIGSDMILTLIEPDLDLDNDQAESYNLDLIEWDSDADQLTMGKLGGQPGKFDPEPSTFRETGDSTGIFQVVIEIPSVLGGDRLERAEQIDLEYTDWGPSGADYVGDEDEDVQLTIFTSNFGATVELDQKVYTWTDKVYITIVAPDLNFDSNLIDEIGTTADDNLTVSTRTNDIDNYKLVETGTDTGIFTGEVILTGFPHDADGDRSTGDTNGYDTSPITSGTGSGPTDGFVEAGDDDGLTISFEFSDGEHVTGSALIRWNIGEAQWLEASYPASGTGVMRVIDPDMNIDPEAVDNFNVDVWSDSDAGGIDLTVTETNEATGIFEGTVFFTVNDQSSGHRLRVAEGDTVTAEYQDNTLPDPYTTADELDVSATTLIGTIVPPLERAPAANLRTVDAFGNSLNTVTVDQQVQISADLSNGQDKKQDFAYLVQVQDGDGVTVSLAWITGSLTEGQLFSPALSWIPTDSGSYTATAFVWESVDNPTALSPPVSTTISVS